MDKYIGKREWYGEKEEECPWRNTNCDVKLELRPAPICLYCVLGHISSHLEELDSYFFTENIKRRE